MSLASFALGAALLLGLGVGAVVAWPRVKRRIVEALSDGNTSVDESDRPSLPSFEGPGRAWADSLARESRKLDEVSIREDITSDEAQRAARKASEDSRLSETEQRVRSEGRTVTRDRNRSIPSESRGDQSDYNKAYAEWLAKNRAPAVTT